MEVLHNNSSSLVVVRTNCVDFFPLVLFLTLYSLTFQDAKQHSFLLLLFWFQSSAQKNLFFFYTCLKINKRQNMNFYSFNLLNTALIQFIYLFILKFAFDGEACGIYATAFVWSKHRSSLAQVLLQVRSARK